MAWNPSPEVAIARDAARQLKANRIVILYMTELDQIGYASYGETKPLCDETRILADVIYEAAMTHYEAIQ